MLHSRTFKVLIALVAVIVFASATYAFAASNTVPTSYAGEGAGAVSGYTVTNLVYNLNAANPSNVDSVVFTLSAAATNVQARMVTTGSYYSCTNVGLVWTCATTAPQLTMLAADELRIIARDH